MKKIKILFNSIGILSMASVSCLTITSCGKKTTTPNTIKETWADFLKSAQNETMNNIIKSSLPTNWSLTDPIFETTAAVVVDNKSITRSFGDAKISSNSLTSFTSDISTWTIKYDENDKNSKYDMTQWKNNGSITSWGYGPWYKNVLDYINAQWLIQPGSTSPATVGNFVARAFFPSGSYQNSTWKIISNNVRNYNTKGHGTFTRVCTATQKPVGSLPGITTDGKTHTITFILKYDDNGASQNPDLHIINDWTETVSK